MPHKNTKCIEEYMAISKSEKSVQKYVGEKIVSIKE